MEALVINLQSRPDRWRRISSQLHREDIAFERVAAISPYDERIERFAVASREMAATEVACTASHLWAYGVMLERGLPHALIVEDDAVLAPRFRERLLAAVRILPPDFDVLQVGYLFYRHPLRSRLKDWLAACQGASCPRDFVLHGAFRYGAHAYLISAAFARTLLDVCNPIWCIIDVMLAGVTEGNRRTSFLCRPPLAVQAVDLGSDLEDGRNAIRQAFPPMRVLPAAHGQHPTPGWGAQPPSDNHR